MSDDNNNNDNNNNTKKKKAVDEGKSFRRSYWYLKGEECNWAPVKDVYELIDLVDEKGIKVQQFSDVLRDINDRAYDLKSVLSAPNVPSKWRIDLKTNVIYEHLEGSLWSDGDCVQSMPKEGEYAYFTFQELAEHLAKCNDDDEDLGDGANDEDDEDEDDGVDGDADGDAKSKSSFIVSDDDVEDAEEDEEERAELKRQRMERKAKRKEKRANRRRSEMEEFETECLDVEEPKKKQRRIVCVEDD